MRTRSNVPIGFVLTAAAVFALTVGPLYRVRTWWQFDDPLASDPFVVAIQAAVAIVGIGLLATGGRLMNVDRWAGLLAAALSFWLVASTIWSLDPGRTIREALLLAGTLAAGAAAACTVRPTHLLWALWAGVHAGLAWSAVAIWQLAPGTQDARGDWTGVYFNRNSLALIAAIGMLASALLVASERPNVTTSAGVFATVALVGSALADAVLILGSDSLTPALALVAALGVVVLGPLAAALRRRGFADRAIVAGAGIGLGAGATLGWLLREPLADAVGRDADFSGRADIWDISWNWFARRPLIGQGYLGSWGDEQFQREMVAARGEVLSSAHNSFMEVLLGGGLVGIALLVALVAVVYWRVGAQAVGGQRLGARWPLVVLLFVVVEQLSETLLVGGHITVAMLGALLTFSSSSWSDGGNDPAGSLHVHRDGAGEVGGRERPAGVAAADGDPR